LGPIRLAVVGAALILAATVAPDVAGAAVFPVTTVADSGTGSLRAQITASNAATPGPNAITFAVPGSGIHTITPASALPAIVVPVSIDGSTQPGFAGTPLIRVDGATTGGSATGLSISGGSSTVRALEITGWGGSGIDLSTKGSDSILQSYIGTDGTSALGNTVGVSIDAGSSHDTVGGTTAAARNIISGNTSKAIDIGGTTTTHSTVEGNFIGTNAAGTVGLPVFGFAVSIGSGASQNVIGGTVAGSGNVISVPSSIGVQLADSGTTGNTVEGNRIGTNAAGTAKIGSLVGINIRGGAQNNTIGGLTLAARNVISGASDEGIEIHDFGTTGNLVQGNFIGTNAAGTTALGNGSGFCGVALSLGASSNTIGGSAAGARNVISGNACGVLLTDNITATNTVAGNYLGTNATGTAPLPNGAGVEIRRGANANTVGGTVSSAANLIVASSFTLGTGNGVYIHDSGTKNNVVEGNIIGTNAAGATTLGNQNDGVAIVGGATGNTVGGTSSGDRNVLVGSGFSGVEMSGTGTSTNTVVGNLIGTDTHGTATLGNFDGVNIGFGASGNTVGGTTVGARNVISANTSSGIDLEDSGATGNHVEGNFIGTTAAGTVALGNSDGVQIHFGAASNTVGGTAAGDGNVISGNSDQGVSMADSGTTENLIEGNLIGTNATGTAGLGNGDSGVRLTSAASSNTVGGAVSAARNVISDNTIGISVANSGTTGNLVEGNFIGTNAAGTASVGNGDGVLLYAKSSTTTIGGSAAAANLISGNLGTGVKISASQSNLVRSNLIGLAAGGSAALGNGGDGVLVFNAAVGNTVGGTAAGQGNQIAHNAVGVAVNDATTHGTEMLENSIFLNGRTPTGPGITLSGGANASQSAPVITSVTTTKVTGTAGSATNRIEVYSNPSCTDPEGQKLLGAVNSSAGTWSLTVSPALTAGQGITATATNLSTANSSAFSACKPVP
jgi:titin